VNMNDVAAETPWRKVCLLDDIPRPGARVVKAGSASIAVFRTETDEVFALNDRCPHKGGPLSQGIVFGRRVACPLHSWSIELESGEAVAPDQGCAGKHAVKVEAGTVWLQVANAGPAPGELP
jgi:nitrite reductase (NADH) small subunit